MLRFWGSVSPQGETSTQVSCQLSLCCLATWLLKSDDTLGATSNTDGSCMGQPKPCLTCLTLDAIPGRRRRRRRGRSFLLCFLLQQEKWKALCLPLSLAPWPATGPGDNRLGCRKAVIDYNFHSLVSWALAMIPHPPHFKCSPILDGHLLGGWVGIFNYLPEMTTGINGLVFCFLYICLYCSV